MFFDLLGLFPDVINASSILCSSFKFYIIKAFKGLGLQKKNKKL